MSFFWKNMSRLKFLKQGENFFLIKRENCEVLNYMIKKRLWYLLTDQFFDGYCCKRLGQKKQLIVKNPSKITKKQNIPIFASKEFSGKFILTDSIFDYKIKISFKIINFTC